MNSQIIYDSTPCAHDRELKALSRAGQAVELMLCFFLHCPSNVLSPGGHAISYFLHVVLWGIKSHWGP